MAVCPPFLYSRFRVQMPHMDQKGEHCNTASHRVIMVISKVITVKEKREKMVFTDRSNRLHNTDQSHGTGTTTTMDKSHWEENTQTRKQGITRSPARWGSGVERDKKCLLYSPPSASKNHPQGQNGPCHCPYQPVSGHAHCAEEIGGIQKRKCKLTPQAKNAYAYGEAQFEAVIWMWLRVYIGVSLQLACYCCLCGTEIRARSHHEPLGPSSSTAGGSFGGSCMLQSVPAQVESQVHVASLLHTWE